MFSGTAVSITSTPAASMFRRTAARRAAYSSSVKGRGSLFGAASFPMDIAPAGRSVGERCVRNDQK